MVDRVKLSGDILRPFTGEGDVVAWLNKLKLVAKLQKIEDVASLIPLYLEGNALAVYLEMGQRDQTDAESIEKILKTAFSESSFEAYNKLRKFAWTGESVDVYAAELRRLAGLSGYVGRGLERTVKMAFVSGFPDRISLELQRMSGIETMEVEDLLKHARVLAKHPDELGAVATSSSRDVSGKKWRSSMWKERGSNVRCFVCNGPHLKKDCKEPRPDIICYRCGQAGHISRSCPLLQGNE